MASTVFGMAWAVTRHRRSTKGELATPPRRGEKWGEFVLSVILYFLFRSMNSRGKMGTVSGYSVCDCFSQNHKKCGKSLHRINSRLQYSTSSNCIQVSFFYTQKLDLSRPWHDFSIYSRSGKTTCQFHFLHTLRCVILWILITPTLTLRGPPETLPRLGVMASRTRFKPPSRLPNKLCFCWDKNMILHILERLLGNTRFLE